MKDDVKQAQEKWHRYWSGARRYFLAGLIIVLPTLLTVYIFWFLFSLAGAFLSPTIRTLLRLVFANEIVPLLVTPLSVLITAGLIWLIGFTGAAFSRQVFERTEALFRQIPFVRGIYRTVRQLIDLFFARDRSFKQVALIEYPRKGLHAICFVTNRERWLLPNEPGRRVVPVFVPSTPNPTSGYLILVPEEDIIALDMSVDEAIKVIISGGIVSPPAHVLPEAPLQETRAD